MSMITEIFGREVLYYTKEQVIQKIKSLPPSLREKRAYLLKDFAVLTGVVLTEEDYRDVNS